MTSQSDIRRFVFVFGSNLAGRHGAGAAKFAARHYGAVYGVGFGRTGDAYAIPTKDEQLRTLPLHTISDYAGEFIAYASSHPDETFILTPIGCGLAGLPAREIALMFVRRLPSNVVLSSSWLEHFA